MKKILVLTALVTELSMGCSSNYTPIDIGPPIEFQDLQKIQDVSCLGAMVCAMMQF